MKHLYLLPNLLHPEAIFHFEPPHLDALIAESDKGGRHYLKRFSIPSIPIYLLNEHTKDLDSLIRLEHPSVGLISDAGLCCLADPGSNLVSLAYQKGIQVDAFPGPSAIFLGLMLSGFSGQQFTFHGYSPRETLPWLKKLPKQVTHIFIEAPYRNQKLLQLLISSLHPQDRLCIGIALTGPEQKVITQTIAQWKKAPLPDIQKKPTIFLIFRE